MKNFLKTIAATAFLLALTHVTAPCFAQDDDEGPMQHLSVDRPAVPEDPSDALIAKDPSPVPRDMQYNPSVDIAPAKGHVVTAVNKCFDQFSKQEADEMRRDYAKSYEECQNRLAAKEAAQQQKKVTDANTATTPETPRNYIRVQGAPGNPPVNK